MKAGKDEHKSYANVTFGYGRAFKEIVKQFSAGGAMQNTLLEMLTLDSIAAIREAQPDGHALRGGQFDDEAALTLVAIKILSTFFSADRKLWSLVEKKARRFVATSSGATKEVIDTALEDLVTEYQPLK